MLGEIEILNWRRAATRDYTYRKNRPDAACIEDR